MGAFLISILVVIISLLFDFLTPISNHDVLRLFIKHRLWKKKDYAYVIDANGNFGIEISDGIALSFSESIDGIVIVRCPEEGDANFVASSYYMPGAFKVLKIFPQSAINPSMIEKFSPVSLIYARLKKLYYADMIDIYNMREL